jgi:MFS family permease
MGEASNMAPASALIGDTFGGRYRVLAMAVFAAGGPVAIMICYPIIGRITAEQGWRAAYAFMGLAGLGVATLTLLIVRESRVDPAHGKAGRDARRIKHLARHPAGGRHTRLCPAMPCQRHGQCEFRRDAGLVTQLHGAPAGARYSDNRRLAGHL